MSARVSETPYYRARLLMFVLGSFFLVWLSGQSLTWAQEKGYPSQPIKLIVPNAPGGQADLIGRLAADYLAKELKVPALVENREGAGGMLGANMVLKAKPDGYTILVSGDTTMCAGILQNPNPTYNPFTDFSGICLLAVSPCAYGVYSSSPFKRLTDFVKAAKENPGKLTCGVTAIGSSTHLSLMLLLKYTGMNIKVIPYKGNPDAFAAILGKHVDMLTLTTPAFQPQVKAGEVRILAASNHIPGMSFNTLKEEGFSQSAFDAVDGFVSFEVSANTPKPTYDKLVAAFEYFAKNPEFTAKLNALGTAGTYKNPADYREFLKEKWRINSTLLEELGLKKWQGKIP